MKKLLTILFLTTSLLTFGQLTTTDPDTVCINTPGSTYQVTSTAGWTYNWVVTAPGVITSGQGTNAIVVDWSAASAGLINNGVTVTGTNASGCTSLPIDLDVFILNVVPTITAIGPFCITDPCTTLVGTPAGGTFSGTGVVAGQFCPTTSGAGSFTITYTYIQNGCTYTTTTTVVVNTQPTLSPIQHN